MDRNADILVIGGGMAGLAAARALHEGGARVIVIDKGRGPGGRMATRRVEVAGHQVSFDHGAQYFTARDPAFRAVVAGWEAAGVAARWPAAGEEAWVGTPGMNACLRAMAAGLEVRWGLRAEGVARVDARWQVTAGGESFAAPTLIVAIPAEQAAVLLAEPAPALAARAASVTSAPCWAVMALFAAPLPLGDTFRAEQGPIAWAARNGTKPGREGAETWVIHASPARTRALLDLPKDEVAKALLSDFFAVTGTDPVVPLHCDAHRWLYALPEPLAGEGAVFDAALRIGIAGDWLHSPRVEGAWLSGRRLAALAGDEARALPA
ncbi:NAD(P)/FAD-dependent oxidoreductase [Erythrobacter cryptus]|uniref:NAD(P)/FAD-dependent oxidoreductase n=1 Tax=Erythrobacter cryptus TaxID=196588 RepID=UPI000416E6C0|nr:FAD-dependent oxidoreductase [Erythrobacter cryptus]